MRYGSALPQACFDANANSQPDGNTVVHKKFDHLTCATPYHSMLSMIIDTYRHHLSYR